MNPSVNRMKGRMSVFIFDTESTISMIRMSKSDL